MPVLPLRAAPHDKPCLPRGFFYGGVGGCLCGASVGQVDLLVYPGRTLAGLQVAPRYGSNSLPRTFAGDKRVQVQKGEMALARTPATSVDKKHVA